MAMIPYDEPIDKNTDWGGDSSTGGRPVAGGRVQDFLKGSLQDLSDRIQNISGLGRFLSGWDCTTGLAVTNPKTSPYAYPDGAFFLVAKVGATNYRPDGDRYVVGQASKKAETAKVKVGDVYKYDGAAWMLIALDTQEIPAFSDETAGTIRGKAEDGWVKAENGYGKVQGWQDATQGMRGLMTAADKEKLDGIEEGANKTTVDASLDGKSENPVQNKAVTSELNKKADIDSPAFKGEPTAPTPDKDDSSERVATTAFVKKNMSEIGLSEAEHSYGVNKDYANTTPNCIRVGNTDLHKTLPIQSKMRGCLLDDDGNVVKYLDATSWLDETRDGSMGQVMVEIPAHYRKFSYDNDRIEVRLSEKALLGYHLVPKMYVSAYEAAMDRTKLNLASVVNDTEQYRGGKNTSSWDGTYRSLLGRPVTEISLTNFRKLARNERSDSWNCYTYEAHKAIYWLFVVEYATLNSQADYTPELTAEGFHQGGLGKGVTNFSAWQTFNNYSPFVPCGHTDSLGNGTGVVDYEIKNSSDTTVLITNVPRYRGIENPFGHIHKWTDGILTLSFYVYTCKNPEDFSSGSIKNYTKVGKAKGAMNQYVKTIIGGEEGELLGTAFSGSSTTNFCDTQYIVSTDNIFGVSFGGSASDGAIAGFVCAFASNAPSASDASCGSRLCFHP